MNSIAPWNRTSLFELSNERPRAARGSVGNAREIHVRLKEFDICVFSNASLGDRHLEELLELLHHVTDPDLDLARQDECVSVRLTDK